MIGAYSTKELADRACAEHRRAIGEPNYYRVTRLVVNHFKDWQQHIKSDESSSDYSEDEDDGFGRPSTEELATQATIQACRDRGVLVRPGCPRQTAEMALQLLDDVKAYANREADAFWESKAASTHRRIEWTRRAVEEHVENLADIMKPYPDDAASATATVSDEHTHSRDSRDSCDDSCKSRNNLQESRTDSNDITEVQSRRTERRWYVPWIGALTAATALLVSSTLAMRAGITLGP